MRFPQEQKNLYFFLSARFLATLSTGIMKAGLAWHLYDLTGSKLHLGLLGLFEFIPLITFALMGGKISDQYDRRKIVIFFNTFMVLATSALGFLDKADLLQIWMIYALVFLFGLCRAFFSPAVHSILSNIVKSGSFPKALAMSSSLWQLGVILGPSLAGYIYAVQDSAFWMYNISAILRIWLMLAIFFMTGQNFKPEPSDGETSVYEGLSYVWKRKIILGVTSLDLFAVFLGSAVAILPAFAKDILMLDAAGYGTLRSAPGIGAALIAFFLARYSIDNKIGRRLLITVFGFGLSIVALGMCSNFWTAFAALFCMGAFDLVSVVLRQSIIQMRTPDDMRGRVSAVNIVFISASNELGDFEVGLVGQLFGITPAIIAGGVGTCLIVGIWTFLFPGLRKLNYYTDIDQTLPERELA
ncbi:MAG: MFS transporter [Bdellovibrionota bacterium]